MWGKMRWKNIWDHSAALGNKLEAVGALSEAVCKEQRLLELGYVFLHKEKKKSNIWHLHWASRGEKKKKHVGELSVRLIGSENALTCCLLFLRCRRRRRRGRKTRTARKRRKIQVNGMRWWWWQARRQRTDWTWKKHDDPMRWLPNTVQHSHLITQGYPLFCVFCPPGPPCGPICSNERVESLLQEVKPQIQTLKEKLNTVSQPVS